MTTSNNLTAAQKNILLKSQVDTSSRSSMRYMINTPGYRFSLTVSKFDETKRILEVLNPEGKVALSGFQFSQDMAAILDL